MANQELRPTPAAENQSDLPAGAKSSPDGDAKPAISTTRKHVKIEIKANGKIEVDGKAVAPSNLLNVLRKAESSGKKTVMIIVPSETEFTQVRKIVDLIKEAESKHAQLQPPAPRPDTDRKLVEFKRRDSQVTILRTGKISFRGKLVEVAEVAKLKLAGKNIRVAAHEDAEHQRIVAVLDALTKAGAEDISLNTFTDDVEIIVLQNKDGSYLRFPENVERAMIGDALRPPRIRLKPWGESTGPNR